jgi:hypothetical protein
LFLFLEMGPMGKKGLVISLLFASAGLFAPQSASAFVVSVPGQGSYDIEVQSTAFPGLVPPASLMPWWGNQALANEFATALGSGLGTAFENLGPFFAWEVNQNQVGFDAFCIGSPCFDSVGSAGAASSFPIGNPTGSPDLSISFPWAVATAVPSTSSVPGPMPLLGVAAAFGFSRKLRARLGSRKVSGSTISRR